MFKQISIWQFKGLNVLWCCRLTCLSDIWQYYASCSTVLLTPKRKLLCQQFRHNMQNKSHCSHFRTMYLTHESYEIQDNQQDFLHIPLLHYTQPGFYQVHSVSLTLPQPYWNSYFFIHICKYVCTRKSILWLISNTC